MSGTIIAVITFLISAAVCVPTGMYLRKKTAESKIKGAEYEAERILENAKYALEENGIVIAYPQMDVHVYQ